MENTMNISDDHIDDSVDKQIVDCLSDKTPRSFILFAGAGSGKTRSLVEALRVLGINRAEQLRLNGQQVGVITYTNAACDEIKRRLGYESIFEVSTIHSFTWSLIGSFHSDIKEWLIVDLERKINELIEKQSKGRSGKASMDRAKEIEIKQKRLDSLSAIKRFTYNPNGENAGKDSLNHTEVIGVGAYFLMQKTLMQDILINKFPVLFIDESQDTIKSLVEALFEVQAKHSDKFALGLFGDPMQRIYGHGKEDLGKNIPQNWASPVKKMNHRCPKRVVKLINQIRSPIDNQEQIPRSDKEEGFVRFFILPASTTTKSLVEERVKEQMSSITKDLLWAGSNADVKILTLEHHMAARRMGFERMFEILYKQESFRTGLWDGSLPGLRLFTQQVLPILKAERIGDDYAIASTVRKYSPLLARDTLKAIEKDQIPQIEKAKRAVEDLIALWKGDNKPRFLDVLRNIAKTELFEIPENLRPIASRSETEQATVELNNTPAVLEDDESDYIYDVWDEFLLTPFEQIEPYSSYINREANFDTHQGVKGLEFQRVMVIIDDNEARGFLFSFDKLFGIKEMTKTDMENEREGKDTGINRTKRLFYVTCSRAEKSLAIVYYSSDPTKTRQQLLAEGWFENNEIIDVS